MKTLFSDVLSGLGLTQSEAADFLDVRIDSLQSWSSGRRTPPEGVWLELHKLAVTQDRAARELVKMASKAVKSGAEIELGIANDSAEAQALGWPCVGAQLATFRRAWELLGPDAKIVIVARGSTESSRASIKARQSNN